jgi:hypothetical protein
LFFITRSFRLDLSCYDRVWVAGFWLRKCFTQWADATMKIIVNYCRILRYTELLVALLVKIIWKMDIVSWNIYRGLKYESKREASWKENKVIILSFKVNWLQSIIISWLKIYFAKEIFNNDLTRVIGASGCSYFHNGSCPSFDFWFLSADFLSQKKNFDSMKHALIFNVVIKIQYQFHKKVCVYLRANMSKICFSKFKTCYQS